MVVKCEFGTEFVYYVKENVFFLDYRKLNV